MRIVCLCLTWNRPRLLGQAIACFERQDYQDRFLIVLDDAGQYGDREGNRWRIVSVNERYQTLGEKRNASVKFANEHGAEAYQVWDDDDVYWPHALSASAAALDRGAWARPHIVWEEKSPGVLTPSEAFARGMPTNICYGGSWAFQRWAFEAVGGYPRENVGEDMIVCRAFQDRYGCSVDSVDDRGPWYLYNRHAHDLHISRMGLRGEGYATRGEERIERVEHLEIAMTADYFNWPRREEVEPRWW